MSIVYQINQLLPQTQCRECGYEGCLPYAEAIVHTHENINLCSVGGDVVIQDLAQLLQRPTLAPAKISPKVVAWIDENVCIGCTACIRACPVDAIMGASKYMHTVLADECTGCGLCVAPCPVDCIYLHDVQEDFLPKNRFLAHQQTDSARFQASEHALARFEWHTKRKARDDAERKARLAEREASIKNIQKTNTPSSEKSSFNPADLIAKARARAQTEQQNNQNTLHRENFLQNQIKEAQERATYSRAMRDMQYGTDEEKAQALAWLRAYKEAQAEKELAKSK